MSADTDKPFKPCSIAGCTGNSHYKSGGYLKLCQRHYAKRRRNGDPLGGIPTAQGEPLRYLEEVVLAYEGDECLTWPYNRTNRGYGITAYQGRQHIVSRLVCERANGPPPNVKYEAAHSCGRGTQGCVTKAHLSWKTRTENQADRLAHGTHNRGERSGSAKLRENEVREIRALRGKMLQREIGEKFGISKSTIGNIHAGKIWGWLK